MSGYRTFIFVIIMTMLAWFLLVPRTAPAGQGAEGTSDLLARQQTLSKKLESLKAEQEYLVFMRTFFEADSKYLVLDREAEKGMLMYRNRVLRTFRLQKLNKRSKGPQGGIIEMTGKIDGKPTRRSLLFGDNLAFQWKGSGYGRAKYVVYGLGSRDLAALFYALDAGSKAFIK